MNISTNNESSMLFENVLDSIEFRTASRETLTICMRDTGYEFTYGGIRYEAKLGVLKPMTPIDKLTKEEKDRINFLVGRSYDSAHGLSTAENQELEMLVNKREA